MRLVSFFDVLDSNKERVMIFDSELIRLGFKMKDVLYSKLTNGVIIQYVTNTIDNKDALQASVIVNNIVYCSVSSYMSKHAYETSDIKDLLVIFKMLVDEMGKNIESEKSESTFQKNNIGFIYIMQNKRNGYKKIGQSVNPKYREKTLQSEEPEIDLIWKHKVDNMDKYECLLHEKFSGKRLRGEWFDLENDDVEYIKSLTWLKDE